MWVDIGAGLERNGLVVTPSSSLLCSSPQASFVSLSRVVSVPAVLLVLRNKKRMILACLGEPEYAIIQVNVHNTPESHHTHLFSVSLLGNFGKRGSGLHPAI